MICQLRQAIAAFCLMAAAALAAWWLVPTHKLVDQIDRLDLEVAIPKEFGDWVMDTRTASAVVNPQQKEALDRIYTQLLARTYVNRRTGAYVMLSIAYGESQREEKGLHFPEVCYPAQGFQITSNATGLVRLSHGSIPVRRLETFSGARREPLTYWTTIGTKTTLGGVHKKLIEMSYSLRGIIPDGLLFRVSSITSDSAEAFKAQDEFINEIVSGIDPSVKSRFIGGD